MTFRPYVNRGVPAVMTADTSPEETGSIPGLERYSTVA